MAQSNDYLEMSFRSIQCFSDDGKIKADELRQILTIAERDNVIDQNEIRVLHNIISRVKPDEIDSPMKTLLEEISTKISKITEETIL